MEIKNNYRVILDIVRSEIETNGLPLGTLLPSETEMAQKYDVSRPTIAKVYNSLQAEGYVVKKPGTGTIVTYQDKKSKRLFGLLLPGAGESEIFAIINERFLNHSQNEKFDCLWEGTTTSNAEIRKELIEKCCNNYIDEHVNGIFFAPLERVKNSDILNRKICEKIKNAGIPLVLIDRDIVEFPFRSSFDLVSIDNFNAGYMMAEHLIKMGCKMIHFLYRPDSASSVKLRLYGVAAAMQNHNLKFGKENDLCGNPEELDFIRSVKIKSGETGIICANDSTAAVVMSSLNTIGVIITSDILICGYDDMKYSKHLKYTLTSYLQPCNEIADTAIELMNRRIENSNSIPVTANLTGRIVIRDSSKFFK